MKITEADVVPGATFVWEPFSPRNRVEVRVTRVTPPEEPIRIEHALGEAYISRGSETQVWTVPANGGDEVPNDMSRFIEACRKLR